MIFINGYPNDTLLITDRAFQYGDGCFTTMLLHKGIVEAWPHHFSRLKRNANTLKIKGIDWSVLPLWVEQVAQSQALFPKSVMKVMLTRGSGERGYSPSGCKEPNVIISTHAYPEYYDDWKEKGVDLMLLERRLGLSSLGGIKHLNRLEQVFFKFEIEAAQLDDGVACDFYGKLVEASTSNIFWRKGQRLFTPVIDFSGVAGTMRQRVIQCAKKEYEVEITSAFPHILWDADEMFMTNAIFKLVPVKSIGTKIFHTFEACKDLSLRLDA